MPVTRFGRVVELAVYGIVEATDAVEADLQ